MNIIHQDQSIILVNKTSGVPIQSSLNDKDSLQELLQKQLNRTIYLTHRLDQVASGICLFAKNKKSCDLINRQFEAGNVSKKYLAIVPTGKAKISDTIELKLVHNQKIRKAFVDKKGKKATLHYTKISTSDNYDCLQVEIEGGRFHQIRCMLAHSEMAIKGDVKYGAKRKNKDRSIHLHAYDIAFTHPRSKEIVHFSAPLPSENLWQFFADEINFWSKTK